MDINRYKDILRFRGITKTIYINVYQPISMYINFIPVYQCNVF